jgi:hypothetical protein
MPEKKRLTGFVVASTLILTSVVLAGVASLNYLEDFSTEQHCDSLNTTALWDTGSGVLSLHPFELVLVGSIDSPGDARDVTVEGNYAFTADRYPGLRVIDISDPANPVLAAAYNTSGIAYGVTIDGDYAYVADDVGGLVVIDITDPTNPTLAGSYDTPGYAYDVAIAGDYAYMADYDAGGLQIIDVTDPTNPALAGSYDTPGSARALKLAGDYAYVADYGSGLQVIDISDPTSPVIAGVYDTPGSAVGVELAGNYAFVADYDFGIQVIDISDPTNPTLAGSYDTPNYAWDVAISGDHAYVSDNHSGIHWLDVFDPTNPALIDSYDTPEASYAVAIDGDHIYVADYDAGLLAFERSFDIDMNVAQSTVIPGSPYASRFKLVPTQTGTIQWEFSADAGANWQSVPDTSLTVLTHRGSEPKWRATLVYTPGGVLPTCSSLDIETTLSPVAVLVQSFDARSLESGVQLAWVIEADEEIEGFRIYRGADERSPHELVNTDGLIPIESRSFLDGDVSGSGATYWYTLAVVTADGSEVLSQTVTVRTSGRSLALRQNHPNPFNPATTISFTLPDDAQVDLSIYNLQGQLVKTMVSEALDAGIKAVVWNGTDASGNPVASGVYFYRLRAGKSVMTKKMILLK